MQRTSLVRMYMCFGIGKLTLNRYILQPLGILTGTVKTQRSPWDDAPAVEYEVTLPKTPVDDPKFYMCFMPFQCAQIMCDKIRPDRLAYTAARYMATVLPYYHSGVKFRLPFFFFSTDAYSSLCFYKVCEGSPF